MNLLDIIITVLVLGIVVRGARSGFLRSAGSLGGFLLGIILGAAVAPAVGDRVAAASTRELIVVMVFFGIAIAFSGIGEGIGLSLSGLAQRYRLRTIDSVLGAVFGLVIGLLSVWLLSAAFARSAGPELATQMQQSRILRALDRSLPPAPDVVSRFERALGVTDFPRVFTGLEPTPAPPVTGPNAAAITAAANAGRAATVKIESFGCGNEVIDGSGFVVGPGLVATNAHVVAGIDQPTVIDANGKHGARVVVFDPDMDFAVLRTSNLAASPLQLSGDTFPRGTVGAALGYPGGGDLTVEPAGILDEQTALGRNIYDSGLVRRDIYQLQAVIRPGNSGGPLVTPDGVVAGVIFATSTTNGDVGYALTSAEVLPEVQGVPTAAVSTGPCLAE